MHTPQIYKAGLKPHDGDHTAPVHPCWSCKGPVDLGIFFCSTCKQVQPPGQIDHFARMGVGIGFDLDTSDLERRYFALQRQLHPDRFATRSPKEKALSQQQATSLNDAYEVLCDPLRRAEYLIHMKGADLLPEGCDLVNNDQELLIEAMEKREALAEAETLAEVGALAAQSQSDMATCIDDLGGAFASDDLKLARRLTTRLKYLTKLAGEIRARRRSVA